MVHIMYTFQIFWRKSYWYPLQTKPFDNENIVKIYIYIYIYIYITPSSTLTWFMPLWFGVVYVIFIKTVYFTKIDSYIEIPLSIFTLILGFFLLNKGTFTMPISKFIHKCIFWILLLISLIGLGLIKVFLSDT